MNWTRGIREQVDNRDKLEKLRAKAWEVKSNELTPMVKRLLDELGTNLYGKSFWFWKSYKMLYFG